MVSRCARSARRSRGAVASSSTRACARERKTSPRHSLRSARRRQMSRSAKSKVPNSGHLTTLFTISLCTAFECDMAHSCQARRTWQMRSVASGSLLRRSIFVNCASLSTRNTRWPCCVRAARPPDRCSASLRTSFQVRSTARQVAKRSRASFRTAFTTPPHAPKRSGSTAPRHLASSSSSSRMSPSSMAVCSGGSSRRTCMTCAVACLCAFSCSSLRSWTSERRRSPAVLSSATWRSHSSRRPAILRAAAASSSAVRRSLAARRSARLPSICALSWACSLSSLSRSTCHSLMRRAISSARKALVCLVISILSSASFRS
mmetsp:Transcript_61251/g.179025  ORF Transcript_61251/g.179025 Transcript_61251/m.179025 type:complete len:318 (+) Transcript_61251:42-995(+)